MPGDLRVIASFPTPVDADVLRMRLEAAGIRSVLADESIVGVNWMLGNAVGGVKVLVCEADVETAARILEEELSPSYDPSRIPAEAWNCALCGEQVEGDFEICWACGASREGQRDADFQPEEGAVADEPPKPTRIRDASEEIDEAPAQVDLAGLSGNPYRSPLAPLEESSPAPEELDTHRGDEIADRAWRASIIGLACCPPLLHIYSTGLLLSLAFGDLPLSRRASRRCTIAWTLNLAASAAFGVSLVLFAGG